MSIINSAVLALILMYLISVVLQGIADRNQWKRERRERGEHGIFVSWLIKNGILVERKKCEKPRFRK